MRDRGVQVLVVLSHVRVWRVCRMPFSLWCLSIVLAPVIMVCVLPQKSYRVHFGLSHDGKLQILSSISLTSLFTLGGKSSVQMTVTVQIVSHDAKLQIVSSISLNSLFTLGGKSSLYIGWEVICVVLGC